MVAITLRDAVMVLLAFASCTSEALVLPHVPSAPVHARCPRRSPIMMSSEPSTEAAPAGLRGIFAAVKGSVVPSSAASGGELAAEKTDDDKMTLDKVASFGIAGILSIAVAESVFWILSFPTSELIYFASTGEWIDLLTQEGQLKFLAFTAGWGALGGAIAQYRTVLTAAAMTPWMDANVVKPYVNPLLEKLGKKEAD